jgi:hypothetical protein
MLSKAKRCIVSLCAVTNTLASYVRPILFVNRPVNFKLQVAVVEQKPLFLPGFLASGKSLSLEMLKAGWVTTYEQAGAEYGEWGKDEFLRVEAEAKYERFVSISLFLNFLKWIKGPHAVECGS